MHSCTNKSQITYAYYNRYDNHSNFETNNIPNNKTIKILITYCQLKTTSNSIKTFYIPKYFSRSLSSSYQLINQRKIHKIFTPNFTQNNLQSTLIHQQLFSLV